MSSRRWAPISRLTLLAIDTHAPLAFAELGHGAADVRSNGRAPAQLLGERDWQPGG
jgi:hypothetical protein